MSSKVIEELKNNLKIVNSQEKLENIKAKYLGKKGIITLAFKELGKLAHEKRKERGVFLQKEKKQAENLFLQKKEEITKKLKKEKTFVDITLPGKKFSLGHIHPLSQVFKQSQEIFEKMGFLVVEGPELEIEWYNFDALNFPKDHPAREMQDTLWVKEKGKLMRTHTSPVQVRYMEKNSPPFRIIVPGVTFRNEATDASHEVQFNQLECLMVDKEVSVVDFKAIIQNFFDQLFERKVKVRLRPGFFPFTEPSFEIDIQDKKGNWLECMGAGMVHPKVLENSGVDPQKWQGFAFGFGADRMAMIKFGINDIRLFYSSDLRFLNQF